MRVVEYVRVSTDRQAEDGRRLEVQRSAVRGWARQHGHHLVGVVADEGVSRPPRSWRTDRVWPRRCTSCARATADGIAVYRLARPIQQTLLAIDTGL
jgi:hypothetical protein